MSSAGSKRTYDNAMSAKAFLRECDEVENDDTLQKVPAEGTVGDIRAYFSHATRSNWMKDLSGKVLDAAKKRLKESGTFEEKLHSEHIKYCGFGGREKKLQESFQRQKIKCRVSCSGPLPGAEARKDSISLVLG